MNYYNENDPKAAAWLQELINQKLIPEGHVDTRSITEVTPDDLRPYIQCHFFAGIGGWPYALQLAGVPATTRLWTGSCPCQPFSTAGKGLAQADERHLWPIFFDLIRQCRPQQVYGEQVASAIGHGWLDGISADLEAEGYACGATVLGAHSVSAPHQRQRLYWVAHNASAGLEGATGTQLHRGGGGLAGLREAGTLAYSSTRLEERKEQSARNERETFVRSGDAGRMDDTRRPSDERRGEPRWLNQDAAGPTSESGAVSRLVLSNSDRCSAGSSAATTAGHRYPTEPAGFWIDGMGHASSVRQRGGSKDGSRESSEMSWTGHQTPWNDFRLVACRDGKTRRVPTEPAFFPLAHGVPARVVRLRGYGNAIVPQCAQAFIRAFYETRIQEANTDFC